jgi:hypothetical protein
MTRIAHPLTVLPAMLACALYAAPAQARARVFVASYGNDANPCTFGSPCKTFQQAVNVVDAGGEVTAIDSAGFGPININKAVTITSPDGVEAGIVANAAADAIDITAGPNDAIVLRGLTLNGNGVAYNGVVFNSGASLTVANCVIQDFFWTGNNNTGNGILIQPTSGTVSFVVTDTKLWYNLATGVIYYPASGSPNANGVIDHVVATNNGTGIDVFTTATSGGSAVIAVSNSNASSNVQGFYADSGPGGITLSIDNVTVTGNGYTANGSGINAIGPTKVLLGRSVITGNVTGIENNTSSNTFYTYKDNRINENGTDIGGTAPTLNTAFALQ